MTEPRSATYSFTSTFRAPVPYAFRWCTSYSPQDPRLAKENYVRRVLRRTRDHVTYEDLEESAGGWRWSHAEITLSPPNRWHAEITGSHRHWRIDYGLRSLPGDRSELTFHGRRTRTDLGEPNPSQRELLAELRTLWKNYGTALARDYRASTKRLRPR